MAAGTREALATCTDIASRLSAKRRGLQRVMPPVSPFETCSRWSPASLGVSTGLGRTRGERHCGKPWRRSWRRDHLHCPALSISGDESAPVGLCPGAPGHDAGDLPPACRGPGGRLGSHRDRAARAGLDQAAGPLCEGIDGSSPGGGGRVGEAEPHQHHPCPGAGPDQAHPGPAGEGWNGKRARPERGTPEGEQVPSGARSCR